MPGLNAPFFKRVGKPIIKYYIIIYTNIIIFLKNTFKIKK